MSNKKYFSLHRLITVNECSLIVNNVIEIDH